MKRPCVIESHQSSFSCIDSGYKGTFSNLQGPLSLYHERPFLSQNLQGPGNFGLCWSRHELVVGRTLDESHKVRYGGCEVGFAVGEDDSSAFVDERWGRGGT